MIARVVCLLNVICHDEEPLFGKRLSTVTDKRIIGSRALPRFSVVISLTDKTHSAKVLPRMPGQNNLSR